MVEGRGGARRAGLHHAALHDREDEARQLVAIDFLPDATRGWLPATKRARPKARLKAALGERLPARLADTLSELGLLYRLAGAALIGGSLVPHGGQNPLEAARLGCPVLFGPHTANFTAIVDRMIEAGAALRVAGPAALAEAAAGVLTQTGRAGAMTSAAARIAADAGALPERMAAAIETLLPSPSGAEQHQEKEA